MDKNLQKAKEIVSKAYNLSDAFEGTMEELYQFLDELLRDRKKKYGEDSEFALATEKNLRVIRDIIKKIQGAHVEGFDLLLEFIKSNNFEIK